MTDETSVTALVVEQKPEDFKTAITGELNDRLRGAIADARGSMEEATLPNGGGGKDTGHKQTDEKKTGGKKATLPNGDQKKK